MFVTPWFVDSKYSNSNELMKASLKSSPVWSVYLMSILKNYKSIKKKNHSLSLLLRKSTCQKNF